MRKEDIGDGTEELAAVTGEAERKGQQVIGCFSLGSRKCKCCERGVTAIPGIPETTQHLKH